MFRHAEMPRSVGSGVFVPRQIASVKIDEEESEASDENASRAEVVSCLSAASNVHISCRKFNVAAAIETGFALQLLRILPEIGTPMAIGIAWEH